MAQFTNQIQDWIFASEGGYVDHPNDPGGATNMGITRRTLAAWRGVSPYTALPKSEVRSLTRSEATAIYKAQYWDAIRGDELPVGLDYAIFDYAVNSGPARAVKDLQRVLGVNPDGIVGVITLDAIRGKSSVQLIEQLCNKRWAFVQSLPTFSTFGNGWSRRIWGQQIGIQEGDTGVADRAAKLAMGIAQDVFVPTENQGKATPTEPSTVDTILKDPAGLSGIAGAAAAIFGAIAGQPILQVATVLLVGFLLYRFVVVKKKADPN